MQPAQAPGEARVAAGQHLSTGVLGAVPHHPRFFPGPSGIEYEEEVNKRWGYLGLAGLCLDKELCPGCLSVTQESCYRTQHQTKKGPFLP